MDMREKLFKIIVKKSVFTGIATIVLLVAISFFGMDNDNDYSSQINPKGYNRAYADENTWLGVRGAATLARAANITINTIITSLSEVMGYVDSLPISLPEPIFNGQIGDYWYKLYRNDPLLVDGNTYSGRLESWKVSAGPTYDKAFEFYFDDLSDPTSGEGVLLKIKPYSYDQINFYDGELYEVRYKLDDESNKAMLLTFIGDPDGQGIGDPGFYLNEIIPTYGGCLTRGMVRVTDDAANNWYVFAGMTQRECDCDVLFEEGSATTYYTLGFLAMQNYPHYSTAKFGFGSSAPLDTLCGFPNVLNYGYFSASSGFEEDGVSVSADDGKHPRPADVDTEVVYDHSDDELDVTQVVMDAKTITLGTSDP